MGLLPNALPNISRHEGFPSVLENVHALIHCIQTSIWVLVCSTNNQTYLFHFIRDFTLIHRFSHWTLDKLVDRGICGVF